MPMIVLGKIGDITAAEKILMLAITQLCGHNLNLTIKYIC